MSHAIELDAGHVGAIWTQALEGVRGPVGAHVTFVSKQGRSMEQQIDEIANDQLIIVDPMETGRVRVVLVPAGTGWGQVALAMVDLRYVNGDVAIDETVGCAGWTTSWSGNTGARGRSTVD